MTALQFQGYLKFDLEKLHCLEPIPLKYKTEQKKQFEKKQNDFDIISYNDYLWSK